METPASRMIVRNVFAEVDALGYELDELDLQLGRYTKRFVRGDDWKDNLEVIYKYVCLSWRDGVVPACAV